MDRERGHHLDRAQRVAGIDIRERKVSRRKRLDDVWFHDHRTAAGGGRMV
jgi:hypothetical protein